MEKALTPEHKQSLDSIKRALTDIGPKEANFLRVELLFFQTMAVARHYGDSPDENRFLAALKQLQLNEYQATKIHFKKSSQQEQVIKKFISVLKRLLAEVLKKVPFAQSVSYSL